MQFFEIQFINVLGQTAYADANAEQLSEMIAAGARDGYIVKAITPKWAE